MTASISCINSALSLVHLLHLQPLPLYMHSLQTDLTTAACSMLASLRPYQVGCLNRVLCSAARLSGGIRKFAHVSRYMHDVLHWLPTEKQISFRIASLVWRCLLGLSPVSSVVHSSVLWARNRAVHPNRVFSLSLLPIAPLSRAALSLWWAPRPGTASLLNFAFFLEPHHLRFFSS